MNLAITLLVAVAIASVVGTVLQQHQPYGDYLVKFGPFWFEVFRSLGLYDVYSSSWFLFILTFLIVSTTICLYRHTPQMWREMTRYRTHVREASLRALSHRREWRIEHPERSETALAGVLQRHGYRMRHKREDSVWVIGAMKGRANRLGYIFTHLAIVVICVGGLIDGNLPLKWREWTGALSVETRSIPVSQIGAESRLPPNNPAFRGNVMIPEGRSAAVAFLPLREGYVVQELPFRIEVEEFRIEHYDTGQPRSFESDLIVHDPDLDEPIRQTIEVNHPLVHRGFAIYQASFSDGGSELALKAWPLDGSGEQPWAVEGTVLEEQTLALAGEDRRLELTEFEVFNVRPDVVESGRRFRNIGPSFTYRLRRPTGEAFEYENFMLPVQIDDGWYYLSGVRRDVSEAFQYLHIPADPRMQLDRFMNFAARLHDAEAVEQAALAASERVLAALNVDEPELITAVAHTAEEMVERLTASGFDGIERHLNERLSADAVEPSRREAMLMFSRMVLESTLDTLYRQVLTEEGVDGALSEEDQRFYLDALNAIAALPNYASPVYLQLTDFNHIQATGLQITRAPGQHIVYFGSALLLAGVFLLFFVPQRRLWALTIFDDEGGARLLLAGAGKRDPLGFDREFERIGQDLNHSLGAAGNSINETGKGNGNSK